jgi:hypothetical protein
METNIEIREVTDIAELLKIVPFEVEVMKKEPKAGSMLLKDKITWIEAELSGKSIYKGYGFKVFFFYRGDELVCFTVLSITKSVIKYFDEIRIYRVWHKDPECVDKFWELIKWLGKEHKIKKIRLETNRPSAERLFRRKYGLRSVSINMEGVI